MWNFKTIQSICKETPSWMVVDCATFFVESPSDPVSWHHQSDGSSFFSPPNDRLWCHSIGLRSYFDRRWMIDWYLYRIIIRILSCRKRCNRCISTNALKSFYIICTYVCTAADLLIAQKGRQRPVSPTERGRQRERERERDREREREWKTLNFRDGAIFLFQAKSRRHVREIWHCLSLPARDLWLRPLVKSSQHGVDVVEVYANWLAYLGWTAQVRAVSQAFPALRIGVQENRHEYRTKLGMTKVVLRGSWGCHHCKTDRGPP